LALMSVDELHMARQQPLEQRQRPALQRFGHKRVVGVGRTCFTRSWPRLHRN
jgi:hypothetical protein